MFIDIVADYGGRSGQNDLAFLEVKNAILSSCMQENVNISSIHALSTNAFNTIEAGFISAQLAMNSKLPNYCIFQNVAPRKDNLQARHDNEGEFLALSILKNGVFVVGVNAGYCFSFLKNISDLYRINCDIKGSQFRSRDVFPDAFAKIAKRLSDKQSFDDLVLSKIDPLTIPDLPQNCITYIDGYGNIKTNLDISNIKSSKLSVTINNITNTISIGKGIFDVNDGEAVIAGGSSGWIDHTGSKARFIEIVVRGSSAARYFGYPKPGDIVTVKEC